MCGVVGCVANQDPRILNEIVCTMQAVQRHRGPDQGAEWVGEHVALGAARLSIIDLSEAGDQPMISPDGRYVLAYNGELYNFRQLRARLERDGVQFRSSSDTEVALAALAAHGEQAIPDFDGMFAFAFVDTQRGILLLARDRAGIKPLHYYIDENIILFASEIKSIWAALGQGALKPDLDRLRDIFSLGYSYGETTPFLGVKSLEPGCLLQIDLASGEVEHRIYHDLLSPINERTWREAGFRGEEVVERELEDALQRSVQAHLVSDAPLGVICSGGIDSSLIAAMACQSLPDLELYHASIQGPAGEEKFARLAADHIGAEIHTAGIDRAGFLKNWPLAVYHNDFPSYHPNDVPLYIICQLARKNSVKVLLSGEGADELFGGYTVNLELHRRSRWRRLVSALPKRLDPLISSLAEAQILGGGSGESLREIADICGMTSVGRARGFVSAELLFQGRSRRLRRSLEIREKLGFLPEAERVPAGYMLERMFGHLGSLLLRNDRMGMMACIETRIPYLSNELLASWVPMPLGFKIKPQDGHQGLKYLLRRIAGRYLPREIAQRHKMGFPVPLNDYIRPNWWIFDGGFLEQVFMLPGEKLGEVCQNSSQFYKFASVELWGRIFFLNEAPEKWSEWVLENL
jgi:asparagine synthase (glutamine-hydrolysing)